MSSITTHRFATIGMPTVGATVSTERNNSVVTLAHFRTTDSEVEVVKSWQPEDAYMVIHQLSNLPEHDLWLGGKRRRVDAGPPLTMNVLDLKEAPSCRIEQPFENMHVLIPRAALDDIADEADAPRIAELHAREGWGTSDVVVANLLASIAPAMQKPEEASTLFVDHVVVALQTHIARTYGGMRDATRLRNGGLAPWQERRAKELLAANLSKELSLQEIAAECRLSISYFSRAFKISTGQTPHGWRQGRRIERAKVLLVSADLPLADIALSCGFADQSHFTRVFAKLAGDTPGSWRRFRWAA